MLRKLDCDWPFNQQLNKAMGISPPSPSLFIRKQAYDPGQFWPSTLPVPDQLSNGGDPNVSLTGRVGYSFLSPDSVLADAVWVGLLKWDYYCVMILGTVQQKDTLKMLTKTFVSSIRKMARDGLTNILGWANFSCAPKLARWANAHMATWKTYIEMFYSNSNQLPCRICYKQFFNNLSHELTVWICWIYLWDMMLSGNRLALEPIYIYTFGIN